MPDPVMTEHSLNRSLRWSALLLNQVTYQLRLLSRSTRSLFAGILLPVLVLLMHGNHSATAGAQLALVAGLSALGVISSAFVTHANTLVIGRETGVLRRWRMTPLPSSCYFAGKIVATVLVADASALVTVLVAALTGVPVTVAGALQMLIPMTVGALTWASLGTAVSAFIPTATAAYPLLTVTYLPVALMSGALGPGSQPTWMGTLAGYLPARPLILAGTGALRHPGSWPVLSLEQAGVLLAWLVVGLTAALLTFRWNPTSARQPRGRLTPPRSST